MSHSMFSCDAIRICRVDQIETESMEYSGKQYNLHSPASLQSCCLIRLTLWYKRPDLPTVHFLENSYLECKLLGEGCLKELHWVYQRLQHSTSYVVTVMLLPAAFTYLEYEEATSESLCNQCRWIEARCAQVFQIQAIYSYRKLQRSLTTFSQSSVKLVNQRRT